MQITNHCGTAESLNRNSQAAVGGVTLSPIGDGNKVHDEGWRASQYMANGSVVGSYKLVGGASNNSNSLYTSSTVVAPFNAAMETLSLLVTEVSTDSETPITVQVSTFSGRIIAGHASVNGKNETWGSYVVSTEGPPKSGLRSGKNISVAIVTRIIPQSSSGGGASKAGFEESPPAAATTDGTHFTVVKGGRSVAVVTAILSNIDNHEEPPLPAAIAAVRALGASDIPHIKQGHNGWWSAYWQKSSISLPTRPQVERFWYSSQYTSGASVRANGAGHYGAAKTAPALMTAWLVGGGDHNGYTLDYNAEAQFYGVASSNHPELVLPYATVVLDFVANARTEAEYFKCPGGLHFPGAVGPFGYYNMGWMHMHSHGSFAALPLIWHWQYTRNTSFLMDGSLATSDTTATPYALVKGLAQWWLCHLTKEDSAMPSTKNKKAAAAASSNGNTAASSIGGGGGSSSGSGYVYSDLDDCAYEDSDYYNRPARHPNSKNFCNGSAYAERIDLNDTSPILRNPTISLSFATAIFKAAIEMAQALGVDSALQPEWRDRVDNMAAFPTATINNGTATVFAAQEHPLYFPGSTNPLAFYAMWPGENVGISSPEPVRKVAAETVLLLGAMGAWGQGNAFPETFPAAVRAGVDPKVVLGNMTIVINKTMPRNILGNEGQECAGATQAVNDMLCSSYDGVIRLFAAWPLDEPASFTTLRAKGSFLVSAVLNGSSRGSTSSTGGSTGGSENVVSGLTITSEVGQPVLLLSPWKGSGVAVTDKATGNAVVVKPAPQEAGVYTWKTSPSTVYVVGEKRGRVAEKG